VSDTRGDLVVGTLGGLKPVKTTLDHDGTMHMATVNMGVPVLRPADIPTELRCGEEDEYVVNCELETESEALLVTCVSMGNPHAVTWVEDLDSAPVDVLGPLVETDKAFPNRTNVEFATVLGEERLGVRVWERGVGETLACGTGACATLVAATLTCRAGREASIELPGGELHVRWNAEDDCVYLTGPAEEVFSGTIEVLEEDS
jgi:diaminopimelate epimerase